MRHGKPECPGEVYELIVRANLSIDLRQATLELLEYRIDQVRYQKKLTDAGAELRCSECNKLLGKITGSYSVKCPRCGTLAEGANRGFADDLPPCYDCRPLVFKHCKDTGIECVEFSKYTTSGRVACV